MKKQNSPPNDQWKFTAMCRLGAHWQHTGDYVRAQAAYSEALRIEPEHRACWLNLAVTQIRLGAYEAAGDTLDVLCGIEKLPTDPRASENWKLPALSVAYNRALVFRYLDQPDHAKEWSEQVAAAVLNRPENELPPGFALTALMLHARILLDVHQDDHAFLAEAADGALAVARADPKSPSLESAAAIEHHVRQRLRADGPPDPRVRYNRACYLACLTDRVPAQADELAKRVVEEAQAAFLRADLVPWAKRDPALAGMQSRSSWQQLLEREADPASPLEADGDRPAPAVPSRARTNAIENAVTLLEGLHVDAGERRARRGRDPLIGLKQLRQSAGSLDEPAFQLSLFGAVAQFRDPVTSYLVPPQIRERASSLPLQLGDRTTPDGGRVVVVAASTPEMTDLGLAPGVPVTGWNGVPIEQAIEARLEYMAASDLEGRRARAIASLTHRPTGVLTPLDADETAVGYGEDGRRVVLVDWEYRRVADAGPAAALQSTDPFVATIGQLRSPGAGVSHAELQGSRGLLRIRSFEVPDAGAFVKDVRAHISRLPSAGLVIDLRGNGGGSIEAAERLLQLFSAGPISPQPVQLRATRLTAQLVGDDERFRPWSESIERALHRNDPFSDALPLTAGHVEACNDTGQVYEGPVVVVIDALSAGAADIFTAGFADHRLGRVLATARRAGMAGGVAWRTDEPASAVELLKPLRDGSAFQISLARTLRVGGSDPRPLTEHPVLPDEVHYATVADGHDEDTRLLAHAATMLSRRY